jgi:hypothetical protein
MRLSWIGNEKIKNEIQRPMMKIRWLAAKTAYQSKMRK